MFLPKRYAFLLITLAACSEPIDGAADTDPSTTGDTDGSGSAGPTTSATMTTATTATSATSASSTDVTDGSTTDDDPSESDASSDAGDTSTGEPVCEGDCAIVPDGWSGPVVTRNLADGGCSDLFATEVGQYGAGFEVPPATCECSCSEVNGASCSLPSMRYNLNSCAVNVGAFLDLDPGCNDTPNIEDGFFHLTEPVFSGGSCDPIATTDLPPAGFADDIVLCSAELDTIGCDADAPCVPPQDEPVCIWQEGEHTCPAEFPTAQVMWTGIEDGRSCTECTCGEVDGACDMNDAVLYPVNNICALSFDPVSTVEPGGCTGHEGMVGSINLPTPEPVGSCAPSDVGVAGDVLPTGAVTVCCAG